MKKKRRNLKKKEIIALSVKLIWNSLGITQNQIGTYAANFAETAGIEEMKYNNK